jgi:hypothetical protein
MKKLFFAVFALLIILSSTTYAQKYISKQVVDPLPELAASCNKKIDVSTKTLYFFTNWKEEGFLTIAKGDTSYYLMITYLNLPNKEYLSGSIHLLLGNNEKLNLNACGEDINKKGQGIAVLTPFVQILRSKNTYCLYEINRNDLEKISKNGINTIQIDYTTGQIAYDTQPGKRKYHKIAATNILEL